LLHGEHNFSQQLGVEATRESDAWRLIQNDLDRWHLSLLIMTESVQHLEWPPSPRKRLPTLELQISSPSAAIISWHQRMTGIPTTASPVLLCLPSTCLILKLRPVISPFKLEGTPDGCYHPAT
jgi:hypothetical protein